MEPDHFLVEKLARATRSLGRAAVAVKVICGVAYLWAGGFFFYGLSRMDRSVDDVLVFSLRALGIAAVALLFWSIVSFHVAAAAGMGLLGSLHEKLDTLLGAMAAGAAQANEAAARRAGRPRGRVDGPAPPAGFAELDAAAPAVAPSATEEASEVSGVMRAPTAAATPGPAAQTEVAAPTFAAPAQSVHPAQPVHAAQPVQDEDSAAENVPRPPRPEPTDGVETKGCRACGSEIRSDATRCRWCMKAA
ncbi:MAG: hypothetical protein WKG00_25270 [Polyangiaceae bacterium]